MTLPTFDPGFSTSRTRDILSADQRFATMLRFEATLAGAQASEGIVPEAAAEAIAQTCRSLQVEPAELSIDGWEAGSVVLVLLEKLRAGLDPGVARWLHFGATTQDVVDTTLVLQARAGFEAMEADVQRLVARCRALASTHRATPALGRTFLQPAIATTFGHRAARWMVSALEALARLRDVRASLPLQLGGPVGHLSVLGPKAGAVRARMAQALGLRVPTLAWHADRAPIRAIVVAATEAAEVAAKTALDVALLAQPEIGEVRVRPGRSSSMPHKSNPADALHALAAAEACRGVASVVRQGAPQALERGLGAWHAEAFAVPLVIHTSAAALDAVARCLEELEPDVARMAAALVGDFRAEVDAAVAEVDQVLWSLP